MQGPIPALIAALVLHLRTCLSKYFATKILETLQYLLIISRTTDIKREVFFKNLKLLDLGRQIGLKFWGAFWLFPAKLLALFWHYESLVHGKV